MNKKLLLRKTHRYIGLIIAIQLLAWTLGGIWFTWNDIDKIHGDHLKKVSIEKNYNQKLISTQIAIDAIEDFKALKSIKVVTILDEPVYQVSYQAKNKPSKIALVNALNGLIVKDINKVQAIKIAQLNASFNAKVATAELITETNNHHEYRNKELPVWAITFDHPSSPTFYISEKLGTLTSVRHTSWRIFDFLWMLHTMDYQGRDDFGNWLIKVFSIIALITALSGIVLFIISSKRRK